MIIAMHNDNMCVFYISASIHRSQVVDHNGDIVVTTAGSGIFQSDCQPITHNNLTFENSKRVLIASHRHLRNDSKTIQLEMRFDGGATNDAMGGGGDRPPLRTRNTHHRSSSCDVKMMRDDEGAKYKRAIVLGHSRNNSRDASEFRAKLTHSRNNSSDRHNTNIKYILNYLNTPKLIVPAANVGADGKKHTRNHSYDQIYMPTHIRIDQEFQRRFNKNVSRKNSVAKVDASMALAPATSAMAVGDSAAQPTEDAAGNSVLRHRRTSSKDLNRLIGVGGIAAEADALMASAVLAQSSPKHVRQSSQHRIQIDAGLDATNTIAESDGSNE